MKKSSMSYAPATAATTMAALILTGAIIVATTAAAAAAKDEAIFTQQQHDAFHRDGYLVVGNLLDSNLVDTLSSAADETVEAAPKIPFYFNVFSPGIMFGSGANNNTCDSADRQQEQPSDAFRRAALFSNLPAAAAELMQLDPETQNLRVLRDVFLARSINDTNTCGWHVDDQGFWPESFLSEASERSGKDQDGLNVWVALDDMPAAYRGSMAVAPGSHDAPWSHEARLALGQNHSADGGKTKEEIIRRRLEGTDEERNKFATCALHENMPELYQRMTETGRVLDIARGDVVFATRKLFHRTTDVTPEGLEYYEKSGVEFLKRYSIRYVPGTARLPDGWSVEWSVIADPRNAGRSLDDIVRDSGTQFYPKVWPELGGGGVDDLRRGLDSLAAQANDLTVRSQAEFRATIFGS